ncbi:diguanylate cyclase [Massilia sp. KIM]|uniref:diguanylate cyclase domain-containing protein n=1 Tax=Massilia sp. KIM TaxID=1955422 RepID=UPI00098F3BD9|nr:diguanylate cyclase [Massilia sp. KIM]OON62524.1 diguanylate cyclase [Massilia sp. KIM]
MSGVRPTTENLKFRLACVAAALVFAATLLVTLSTLAVAERGMKAVIGDQQYRMITGVASFMDDRIATRVRQIETLAGDAPPGALQDKALMRGYLANQARLWGTDYLNLLTVDRKGDMFATVRDFTGGRRLNASGRDYFERVLRSGASVVSEPLRSRLSDQNIVVVAAPLRDPGGEVQQVLVASIDLDGSGFLRQLNAFKPGGSGYLFLMTADGIVIDHPDKARVLKHINTTPGVNQATERALKGFEGWAEARSKDGRDSMYAYKRLQSTGWILGVRYPSGEAFAPLEEMRRNAIFGATGLALAAGLLAWVLVFRLLGPLETLRAQVRAIRHEGAEIGVLRHGRQDEIGELGRAFHALMAEREAAEDERGATEKRLRLIADNLPVLIAYVDRDRRFSFGNATFETWFGVPPDKLIGMSMSDLLGPEAGAKSRDRLDEAFAGREVTCELRTAIRGVPRYLQGNYIPDRQPDGAVAGVYLFIHDVTPMKEVEERLVQLTRIDPLTGIANRRMFGETLQHALDRARRSGKSLALAYLDVDHFKRINDSYGHGVGDEVLKEFARRLTAGVRATDTPARLSGDEFVVILEEISTRGEAERIGDKIVAAMRVPIATSKGLVLASSSVGIAVSGPGQTQEQLLAAADSALYMAKGKGRDGFAVYEG